MTDLEPIRGSEADKRRPAVLVSNDQADRRAGQLGRGVVTVVPVTSVARVLPFQVLLPAETGLPHLSKAHAEQVRSINVSRLVARLGRVPPAVLTELDAALRLHLSL